MKHKEINKLIKENELEDYLEIGYGNGDNFNKIKCKNKIAVDPNVSKETIGVYKMKSDEFFKINTKKFTCIFIDGLHHSDQFERDVINAFDCLKQGGFIICHDINPKNESMTIVPRKQAEWTGDVFRVWAGIKKNTKLKTFELKDEYGLGVIEKKGMAKPKEGMTIKDLTFDEYNA